MSERSDTAAWLVMAAGLIAVLTLHLLPTLLSALLVYELVHLLAGPLHIVRIRRRAGKLVAVAILATGIVGGLVLAVVALTAFVRSEAGSVPALLQKLADVLDGWRTMVPASMVDAIPGDVDEIKETAVTWLRGHAGTVQHLGREAGRVVAHIIVGLGIGMLVALHDVEPPHTFGPLARSLHERVTLLGDAFRRVVFGQLRISAINAVLTGLYLVVGLRLAGIHLPLAKTMIVVTFVLGLLPVVGNLISNTIIVILSLSVSLSLAVASLVFLVVIHKLEYFLNAQIVGSQVRAHAWELLGAMVVMEAAFGMTGLIAAPIYYAYVKSELVKSGAV
jgi:predicted PurR-regulated permease PerM